MGSKSGPAASSSLKLLSTIHFDGPDSRLDETALIDALRSAQSVDWVAAYFDTRFCKHILTEAAATKKKTSLRLVFNGLSGQRLQDQVATLKKLRKALSKRYASVDIRLARAPGIFHSKLILARGHGSLAFVGSANATTAALERNEEILLRVKPAPGNLCLYFERALEAARPIDDLVGPVPAHHLVAFLRSGSLYYRPSANITFSYNPFTALLGKLDKKTLRKIQLATVRHADPSNRLGAFNLKRALGFSGSEKGTKQPKIKRYVVETCFGFWVPAPFEKTVEAIIQKGSGTKQKRLQGIRARMTKIGLAGASALYQEYLDSAREVLTASGANIKQLISLLPSDPFKSYHGFERLFDRTLARLADEAFLKRFCNGLVKGPVPEVWDDPETSAAFEGSFFEYLAYALSQPHVPLTAKQMKKVLQLQGDKTANEVRSALNARLKKTGWSATDWQ